MKRKRIFKDTNRKTASTAKDILKNSPIFPGIETHFGTLRTQLALFKLFGINLSSEAQMVNKEDVRASVELMIYNLLCAR